MVRRDSSLGFGHEASRLEVWPWGVPCREEASSGSLANPMPPIYRVSTLHPSLRFSQLTGSQALVKSSRASVPNQSRLSCRFDVLRDLANP